MIYFVIMGFATCQTINITTLHKFGTCAFSLTSQNYDNPFSGHPVRAVRQVKIRNSADNFGHSIAGLWLR